MKYDYAIFIGRFQPFHVGHKRALSFATQHAKQTIVLIGSSNLHRSPKNPFTFEERKHFIQLTCEDAGIPAPLIYPINDVVYNDTAWVTQVREIIHRVCDPSAKICVVGHKKDASSFYLDLFNEYQFLPVPQHGTVNATDIRNAFYESGYLPGPGILAEPVREQILKYWEEPALPVYKWLVDEYNFIKSYSELWGKGPFNTADSVVIQGGNILLVTRGQPPFKGALALPGGFIQKAERIIDAAVRELREETEIADDMGKIPHGVLKSYIRKEHLFDAPDRDPRARIITMAYLYELPPHKKFYIKGADDAEYAQWYSLANLNPRRFMSDHWFIIQQMTGMNWK